MHYVRPINNKVILTVTHQDFNPGMGGGAGTIGPLLHQKILKKYGILEET